MVGVNPSAEKYTVFRVGPMLVISSAVSKTFKKCFIHILSDDNETTKATQKSNGDPKPIYKIKITVPSEL